MFEVLMLLFKVIYIICERLIPDHDHIFCTLDGLSSHPCMSNILMEHSHDCCSYRYDKTYQQFYGKFYYVSSAVYHNFPKNTVFYGPGFLATSGSIPKADFFWCTVHACMLISFCACQHFLALLMQVLVTNSGM